MTQRKERPKAEIARVFIRPVFGMSEEIQKKMIDRALEKLGITDHRVYKSSIKGDKQNERGALLHDARSDEVIIVSRLNVLARTRAEVRTSASIDFMMFVGSLLRKCQYILVLDDNLGKYESITSEDDDWKEVWEHAANVVRNGRMLTPEKAKEMQSRRWAGQFRGVVDEWTKNPERAVELEKISRIWRDPVYRNDNEAYEAMPEEVKAQIKSLSTARRIFGRRKPNNKNLGRSKKKVNGRHGSPVAIYDVIENDSIVYTGMTGNPYNRMKSHFQTGIASNDAYMEIIEWFGNRHDAQDAETARINVLLPPRNTMQIKGRCNLAMDRYGSF